MRILVVGAGGIGGYFGGRLLKAGRDVTFLVRPARAAALAKAGLSVRSPAGDLDLANPPTVTADAIGGAFDLIFLSCKAYDLPGAMDSFAPAVGPQTAIMPMLNGMAHMDALDARFGADKVLGGLCLISAMLDPEGRVIHLAPPAAMTFGARDAAAHPSLAAKVAPALAQFADAGFDVRASDAILQEMWEKWVFIATAAGLTGLMRATIGDIMTAGGAAMAVQLLEECAAIAATQGHRPRPPAFERARTMFTTPGSPLTASMARDIEQGGRIEAEQIVGDLLRRGAGQADTPLLDVVHVHLKAYEARMARQAAG